MMDLEIVELILFSAGFFLGIGTMCFINEFGEQVKMKRKSNSVPTMKNKPPPPERPVQAYQPTVDNTTTPPPNKRRDPLVQSLGDNLLRDSIKKAAEIKTDLKRPNTASTLKDWK